MSYVHCKGDNWDASRQTCLVDRPPLDALTAEGSFVSSCFTMLFGGANFLLPLIFYVFYLCIAIASIEERDVTDRRTSDLHRSSPMGDTTVVPGPPTLAPPPRQENPLWGFGDEEGEQDHGGSQAQQAQLLWHRISRVAQFLAKHSARCLISDLRDQYLVTRGLSTTVAQLRHRAGDTSWFLRGLGSYLLWAVAARWVAVFVLSPIIYAVVFIIRNLVGLYTDGDFSLPPPSYIAVLIAEAVTSAILSKMLAFHLLRILSLASGYSTNIVTEIVYDSTIFRASYEGLEIWKVELCVPGTTICYTLWRCLSDIIPYLMIRPLRLDATKYSTNTARRDAEDLVLAKHDAAGILLRAYVTWVLLRLSLFPLFWLLVRQQAQLLATNHRAIVGFKRLDPRAGLFRRLRMMVGRTGWRRIFRLFIQLLLAGMIILGIFAVLAWAVVSQMSNRALIVDWFIREYLDFGGSVTIPGRFWSVFFLFYYNKVRVNAPRRVLWNDFNDEL